MITRHPERRTERLWLRQWRESDLDALAEMDADPEPMRYIGDGSVGTREQTAAALARVRAARDERGYGLFAAEETATGEAGATPPRRLARSWRSPSARRRRGERRRGRRIWSASSASATSTTTPRYAS